MFNDVTKEELNIVSDKSKDNYRTIMLKTNSGKSRKFPLHRLVARAFIPKTDTDKKMKRVYIHHKNWDNGCNFYWNLEWRSPFEIMMMDRIKENIGDKNVITEVVHKLIERGEPTDDIYYMINGQLSKLKLFAIRYRLNRLKQASKKCYITFIKISIFASKQSHHIIPLWVLLNQYLMK